MNRVITCLVVALSLSLFVAASAPAEDVTDAGRNVCGTDFLEWQSEIGPISFAPSEGMTAGFSIELPPGQSGMDQATLVTYDVDVVDRDGRVVGSAVVEAPVAGFGSVGITATDVTSTDVLLLINKKSGSRVPLENNGRLALRVAVSPRRKGINSFTGEEMMIKAKPRRFLQVSVTIFGSDGKTHGVTTVKALISHSMETGSCEADFVVSGTVPAADK